MAEEQLFYCSFAEPGHSVLIIKRSNIYNRQRVDDDIYIEPIMVGIVEEIKWLEYILVDDNIPAMHGQPACTIQRHLYDCAVLTIKEIQQSNPNHLPVANLLGRYLLGDFHNEQAIIDYVTDVGLREHFHLPKRETPIL